MIKTAMLWVNISNIEETHKVELDDVSFVDLKKHYRSWIIFLIYEQPKEPLLYLCNKLRSYIEREKL